MKFWADEELLPGSGFSTVTANEPAEVALPVAVSCVLDTMVVGSAVVPNITCAPETKLEPVTVSVKLPRLVEAGEMPVSTGVGLRSVTALVPFFEESAELTALTVTELGLGRVAGAVYLPEVSMMPRKAEPPAVSLTYQVTAVFCVPVTAAEKVAEAPARTLVLDGETVTAIVAGGVGCWEPEEDDPPPQPATRKGVRRRARNPGNLRIVTHIAD